MYEFDAIGTHWWIERLDGSVMTSENRARLDAVAEQFDTRYSRFRDDSLVMRLASEGQLDAVPEEMIRMLEFSKQLYMESNGAFNLTVGGALHALGYGSRRHAATVVESPWGAVSWHANSVTVPTGCVLDFGGFGKGWLIERFAKELQKEGVVTYLINGGGDIYVNASQPIEFALESPFDQGKAIGTTRIQKGALAGSSSIKRSWNHRGKPYHHIVDPATQESSDTGVVASFVRADSALLADAVATIVILRPKLVRRFERRYNLKVILVPNHLPAK